MSLYQHQFVMIDNKAVLSNAWAGKLFSKHTMPSASLLAGGKDFGFLISDGIQLAYLPKEGPTWQESISDGKILDLQYDATSAHFFILTDNAIYSLSEKDKKRQKLYAANGLTCFTLQANKIVAGTNNGYLELDKTGKVIMPLQQKLPWNELTSVTFIDNQLWFGSTSGAFMRKPDGKFNYYASERWIPSDKVVHIAKGDEIQY
ncbi:MAG: hypothetical protein R2822_30640 [Spirosomataceae bacterium]